MNDKRLPRRPAAHQLEELSRRVFDQCLPKNWVATDAGKPGTDYGADLHVDLFDGEKATGLELLVQMKASEKSVGPDTESLQLKTTTFNYLRDKLQVVMLVKFIESENEELALRCWGVTPTFRYDPLGRLIRTDVVEIVDRAQQDVFFKNERVEPRWRFEYDAVHRLVSAEGREHHSVGIEVPQDRGAVPVEVPYPPHPSNTQALTTYHEDYTYDEVGNLLSLHHRSGSGRWTSRYEYAPGTNWLTACGRGERLEQYSHDENGNITKMPASDLLEWDYAGRLRGYRAGETRAAYDYDGTGTRTRKAVQRGAVSDERVYAADYERFTRRRNGSVELARQTTHITVGAIRVSSTESAVAPARQTGASATARTRFRLHDHLESVRFEVDDAGNIVSYEEYHPFGTSAYRAGASATEVSEKRFRYLGKELDEETGLYYFGARYYAPWLGRWMSCDPLGLKDGPNLFAYVENNPTRYVDDKGLAREDTENRTTVPLDVREHQSVTLSTNDTPFYEVHSFSEDIVEGKRNSDSDQAQSAPPPEEPEPPEVMDFSHYDKLWDVEKPEPLLTIERDPVPEKPTDRVAYYHPKVGGMVEGTRAQMEKEKRAEQIDNWRQGLDLVRNNPGSAVATLGQKDLSSRESLNRAKAGELVWKLPSAARSLGVGPGRSDFNGTKSDGRTFNYSKHVLPAELRAFRDVGRGVTGPEKSNTRHDLRGPNGQFVNRQTYERQRSR